MSVITFSKKRIVSHITLSALALALLGLTTLPAKAVPGTADIHITGRVVAKTCTLNATENLNLGDIDKTLISASGLRLENTPVTLHLTNCGADAGQAKLKLKVSKPGDDTAGSNAQLKYFNGATEMTAGTAQDIHFVADAKNNAELKIVPVIYGADITTGAINTTAQFEVEYQ